MKFKKQGLICDFNTLDIPWFKKNAMVPIPYLINENKLRIFLGMCDAQNVGRIGYIDVNPNDPSEILDYSKVPALDVGEDGCFDDNGVLPAGILEENGKLYMFYSGYQLTKKVPYLIFSGIAVSEDHGVTFKRLSNVPFLDRSNEEFSIRSGGHLIQDANGEYYLVYQGGSSWVYKNSHKMPSYDIKVKQLNIKNVEALLNEKVLSNTAFTFQSSDEFGFATPQIFIENNIYKMIYSIRSKSKGYRMGYAESHDKGLSWVRKDDKMEIDVSENGWDSEMICFGNLHSVKEKAYLFYCGNHYGTAGMGYAELIK